MVFLTLAALKYLYNYMSVFIFLIVKDMTSPNGYVLVSMAFINKYSSYWEKMMNLLKTKFLYISAPICGLFILSY